MFLNHNIFFQSFDICKVSTKDLEFTSPFSLTAKKDCCVTALIGYFDTYFNSLENKVPLKSFSCDCRWVLREPWEGGRLLNLKINEKFTRIFKEKFNIRVFHNQHKVANVGIESFYISKKKWGSTRWSLLKSLMLILLS